MKVGVVTPWYPSGDNEVSGLFVQREVLALRDAGVDARVVFLDRAVPAGRCEWEKQGDVPVLHIGMNPANPLSVARAVRQLRAALRDVDVVNTHAISVLPAALAARIQKPWVHTEHWSALSAPESASPLLRAVRPAFASMLRAPDAVVAESTRLADAIKEFRGRRTVELIPCIVPSPPNVIPARAEMSSERPDDLRLFSTGGVIERKNPLLAVRTVRELQDRGVRASLRWAGTGDQLEEAKALARSLEVDATFLGRCTPKQIEDELAYCDIFFAPTKGDNFFVAAAEALVNGRPICASDKGGHVEYADPVCSQIVLEQTPAAYADGLLELQQKMRGVTASQVAQSVDGKFTAKTVARMYGDLYGRTREGAHDRSSKRSPFRIRTRLLP